MHLRSDKYKGMEYRGIIYIFDVSKKLISASDRLQPWLDLLPGSVECMERNFFSRKYLGL